MADPLPSNSQITRAGQYLAQGHDLQPGTPEWDSWYDGDRAEDSLAIVNAFRSAHRRPLTIVTVGLRQFVTSETHEFPVVSQRLKRLPRIVRKLHRMQNSSLHRLEDIGGCRAVLDDGATLDKVAAHLRRTWRDIITRERDYVAEPQVTGYRALHFTIKKDSRRIEVQLRTRGQQRWANAIEAIDSRHRLTLKDGKGPDSLLQYFALGGEVTHRSEYGIPIDDELRTRMEAATDRVVDAGYFTRRA